MGAASVGVGFTGSSASFTMAHEDRSRTARPHRASGRRAAGPDPSFPYADGGIGKWASCADESKLSIHATTKDLYDYCQPKWISDYNCTELF